MDPWRNGVEDATLQQGQELKQINAKHMREPGKYKRNYQEHSETILQTKENNILGLQ